mgnify:FL=1
MAQYLLFKQSVMDGVNFELHRFYEMFLKDKECHNMLLQHEGIHEIIKIRGIGKDSSWQQYEKTF